MADKVDVLAVMDRAAADVEATWAQYEGAGALVGVRQLVAELIDSHARLLRLCESCGLPKVADDLAPIAEARRIIAILENATARRASALAAVGQQS